MKTLTLFLILLLTFAANAFSQARTPKTVREFFMALPERYFSIECCSDVRGGFKKRKAAYLERNLNVEDTSNGYLSGHGDAAQDGFVMALFKRPNGTYLVGLYTFGEGGVGDTPWTVFLN